MGIFRNPQSSSCMFINQNTTSLKIQYTAYPTTLPRIWVVFIVLLNEFVILREDGAKLKLSMMIKSNQMLRGDEGVKARCDRGVLATIVNVTIVKMLKVFCNLGIVLL